MVHISGKSASKRVEKKKSSAKVVKKKEKRRIMKGGQPPASEGAGGNRSEAAGARNGAANAAEEAAAPAGTINAATEAGGNRAGGNQPPAVTQPVEGNAAAGAGGNTPPPGAANQQQQSQDPSTQELLYRLALLLKTLVGEEKQSALKSAYAKAKGKNISGKKIENLLEEGLPPSMSQRAREGITRMSQRAQEGMRKGIEKVGAMRTSVVEAAQSIPSRAVALGAVSNSVLTKLGNKITPKGPPREALYDCKNPGFKYLQYNYIRNVYYILNNQLIDISKNNSFTFTASKELDDFINPMIKIINECSKDFLKYINNHKKGILAKLLSNNDLKPRLQYFKNKCILGKCVDLNNVLMMYKIDSINNTGVPVISQIVQIPTPGDAKPVEEGTGTPSSVGGSKSKSKTKSKSKRTKTKSKCSKPS